MKDQELISRDNYKEVLEFLEFQRVVKQCDDLTIKTYWSRLRHLLEWAGGTRLNQIPRNKQTFPAYLGELKKPTGEPGLAPATFGACCKNARSFYSWARDEYRREYRHIDLNWILSIRPPRSRGEQTRITKREVYEVEEVIKLATTPVKNLRQKRTQACVSLLFLSGMRVGAMVSIPADCVNIETMEVYQLPERGVNTKNHKAGITTMLPIPELIGVLKEWREVLDQEKIPGCLWYTPFKNGWKVEISKENPTPERLKTRKHDFRDDLKDLCECVGVEYKSVHKFRHGHAVYALKRAKNMEQMKAISQNLMHSTVGITDGIYGNLVNDNVHQVISSLSAIKPASDTDKDQLQMAIDILKLISDKGGSQQEGSGA